MVGEQLIEFATAFRCGAEVGIWPTSQWCSCATLCAPMRLMGIWQSHRGDNGRQCRAKGGTHATHTSYRLDNLWRGCGHDCIRRARIGTVANERPLPRSGSGGARSELLQVSV